MDRQQLGELSPGDATVALRSYVRRTRELFRPGELGAGGLPLTLSGPDGWSVAALLQAGEAHLARLDRALTDVLHQDQPVLPAMLLQRPGPGDVPPQRDADGDQLLQRHGAILNAMAERVASVPTKDWTRKAQVDGEFIDAGELLREAVAFGRSTLDELGVAVTHLRRSPS
ncbi:MAG: maleylpyruvate isomerase N-terminal domain-containing protein [Acidimicrobiales bacterium]